MTSNGAEDVGGVQDTLDSSDLAAPSASAESLQAMLTVAGVARRLGVAPSTLRTWDRRYGLGPSQHTAGSHRRYSASDLERLVVMRRLTLEGVSPADAAAAALGTASDQVAEPAGDPQRSVRLATVTALPWSPRTPLNRRMSLLPRDPAPGAQGVRLARAQPAVELSGTTSAADAVRGLARAAAAQDGGQCVALLRQYALYQGVVRTWEELAAPVLHLTGQPWNSTTSGHQLGQVVSGAMVTVAREISGSLRASTTHVPVFLACDEAEQDTLPSQLVAAALAERRIASRVLGMQVPRQAMYSAVVRSGAGVVVLHSDAPGSAADVAELFTALKSRPVLILSGRGWGPPDAPEVPGTRRVWTVRQACEEAVGARRERL